MIGHQRSPLCGAAMLVVAIEVLSSGCGGSDSSQPMGTVAGTVTHQGKPLAKARVTFQPTTKGVRAAIGVTDTAGKYTLATFGKNDGAIVGPCQVTIVAIALYEGPSPEGRGFLTEDERQNMGKSLIPEKYFSAETSGLSADVKPGPNTFDFSLRD